MLGNENKHQFLYFDKRDSATAATFRSPLNSVHNSELKPIGRADVHARVVRFHEGLN